MLPKVKGSQPWLVILCTASDQVQPGWPGQGYFNTLVASPLGDGLYTWWQQVSQGNLDLAGSSVLGWYRLSKGSAEISRMRREALVAAAREAATAAGVDLSGYLHTLAIVNGALDNGATDTSVALGIRATIGQPGWHWCANCEGLAFWDGSRHPGPCAAGGRHDHSGRSYYSLPHDAPFPSGQRGWRWCRNCETLVFGTATPVRCPAGGTHVLGTTDYVLRNNSTAANEQPGWAWCNQCQALAYYDGTRQPGRCLVSVTGRHEHGGSGNYSIPYAWSAELGFLAHETGHAYGLDHAFGTSRSGDFVNDSRPGAYGDWTDIMSWSQTASFAVPRYTPAGAGLSAPSLYKLGWLADADVVTVVAPAPAQSVTLGPVHGAGTRGAPRMVRVIAPAQGWVYTAEYRVPQSWDQGLKTDRVAVHAMRTLYQAGQDGWRHCVNCEGLIYAGQTVCPAGGVHDATGSGRYWLSLDAGPGTGQVDWRWCQKCCGLFFAGGPGHCPAGDNHDGSASGNYVLPSSGAGQSNWQWCNKCRGLAFAGSRTPGVCPAGELHDHGGSGNYVVYTTSGAQRQGKWRWCNKCQGLYYAGLGRCKGREVHVFATDDYAPLRGFDGAVGQAGWRHCLKCYGMAFNDGSRPSGACSAGGTHDHSMSGRYVIPTDGEAEAGQRAWFRCAQCSAVTFIDAARGPGPCKAGGNHIRGPLEYLIAHDTNAVPGEAGFRWCENCENAVLGDKAAGCITGGNHDTHQSARYVVRTDPTSLVREQPFWRTCAKCSSLFGLSTLDGSDESPCAVGGKHSPSGEYFLTYVTEDPYWRWCRKCESMASWDGSRAAGPCPKGGRHDHGRSCYIPPRFWLDATQVVHDNLVVGATWGDPSDTVRFEVQAMDGAEATVHVVASRRATKRPSAPVVERPRPG